MDHSRRRYWVLPWLLLAGPAHAEAFLTADEVRALVVGHTMTAHNLFMDVGFRVYFDPDGETAYRRHGGEVTKTRYFFEGDMHCIVWRGEDRCARILDNGDGTYQRVDRNGARIIKWTKVVDGNRL